ncbi:MAG: outer membrane beta-barrel protein [Candidatus Erginobacter occultus]|nr:outer membrane beta-barrel protein [Candidatus Erginobacter occultus]
MKRFRFSSILLRGILSAGILFLPALPAPGLEIGSPGHGISQGSLVIHPRLEIRGEYDDNIFLTDRDRKEDLIGVLVPGIALEFPWDENLLLLDYQASLFYYREYSDQNHDDHRLHGRISLLAAPFSLKAEDTFLKTSSRENTDFADRVERTENTGKAALIYLANKFQVQGGYENYLYRYDERVYRPYDHTEHRGILTGFLQVAPKTKSLLEYTYSRILYRDNKDRDGYYNEVRAGFIGEITSKLTGTAKIGYQERRYREDSIWDDYRGIVGYALLEQVFSREHDLRLAWERSVQESTFAGNSYYLLNRGWIYYSRQLDHKIRGFIRLQYSNYRYPESNLGREGKRRDNIWEPEVGIRYQVQSWLAAEFKYRYRNRDSNWPEKDYRNNRFYLELSAIY